MSSFSRAEAGYGQFLSQIDEAHMKDVTSPHFNKGTLPLAFVFSVPGAAELREKKPVAGDTGMNFTLALRFLVSKEPKLFPSTDRFGYRISNAFDQPMAASLNSGASEAKASQILEPGNVKRVVEELQGCGLVVLCGRKAQLLTKEIERAGMTVVHAWHTGNRALIAKYQGEDVARASTALARQELRAQKWAKDLLVAIRAVRAA